jgi:hypothetical protein
VSLAALLLALVVPGTETWRIEPARPRVGDRIVATTTVAAAPGEALRLARPCDVDVAFAQVEPEVAPASLGGEATLRLSLVAGAPGRFRLGPFALRAGGEAGGDRGDAREIETAPLEIEVVLEGAGDAAPEFGDWRPPLAARKDAPAWKVVLLVGAALGALVAVGWIVRRSRRARATAGVESSPALPVDWRAELARLEAAIPEAVEARRDWWRELSDVVRGELARRDPRDSRDRTSGEIAARDASRAALVALLDDGKFARASRDGGAAAGAVARARALLEGRP